MNKPYIAVAASLDDEHLWDDHFGEAPCYHIFDVHGQLIEKRANPYWTGEQGIHTGPKRITAILPDCGVFIARHMGKGKDVLAQEFGVRPFITAEEDILSAVDGYLTHN